MKAWQIVVPDRLDPGVKAESVILFEDEAPQTPWKEFLGRLSEQPSPKALLVARSPEWPSFKSGRRLIVARLLQN